MNGKWLCLLVFVLCLTGCDIHMDTPIESLNPIYTETNVVFDPALLGRWAGGEPNESFRIERGENNSYVMVYEKKRDDATEEVLFEAHLVSLGGEKYLDMVPRDVLGAAAAATLQMDSAKTGSRFGPALQRIADGLYVEVLGPTPGKGTIQELQIKLRPPHWFAKAELHEKSLSLDFLSNDWVEGAIKQKFIQAQHAKTPNEQNSKNWVLTGSTAELQSLIVRAADAPGAFGGLGVAFQKLE